MKPWISDLAVPAKITIGNKLPTLGSGKTDDVAIKALAEGGLKEASI